VGWRVGAGLLIGVLCALVYWMLALAIETYWPRALDPSLVGLYFATLCLAAPISGGLGAWLGYRSSAYK
jgi:hypothetical protein